MKLNKKTVRVNKRKNNDNSRSNRQIGRQWSEASVRYQLDKFEFRKSDRHRFVSNPAITVVQQVYHRPVEPIERRVVSNRHVERPDDLSLLLRFKAFLLELNELLCCVARDQVASSSMFNRARPACGTSFIRAFRASIRRLLMLPAPRSRKRNGADPCCGSLTISSAAAASRRLRFIDTTDSSSSRCKFSRLSSYRDVNASSRHTWGSMHQR